MKELNKSTGRKLRPVINKKYPGADFKPNYEDDGINKYENLVNLFDPPICISIEDRISEMEDHLNLLLEEDLFRAWHSSEIIKKVKTLIQKQKTEKIYKSLTS